MYNVSYKAFNPFTQNTIHNNSFILDFKQGDVNGDGIIDNVFLIGRKSDHKEIFTDNISILVQNGRTNLYSQIPLINASGYNSQLLLAPFSANNKLDILVNIDSGGSGGSISSYLYSIYNSYPFTIFLSNRFNAYSIYEVDFINNFQAKIKGINNETSFIIDISNNKDKYIEKGIYNKKGKLLKEIQGSVLGAGALYPLITHFSGLYELLVYQRITGINNADNIGIMQTYLKWNGNEIKPYRTAVSILGYNS